MDPSSRSSRLGQWPYGRYDDAMPPASSDRLLIRPFRASDAEAAWAIYEDPEVSRFLGWERPPFEEYRPRFLSRMEAWAGYPQGQGVWAMLERESGRMAGMLMLKPLDEGPEVEVGYHLARWAWGHGYATEGARSALRHGFTEAGLSRIVAVVHPENGRSLRVIDRVGMSPAGDLHVYGVDCRLFEAGPEWLDEAGKNP